MIVLIKGEEWIKILEIRVKQKEVSRGKQPEGMKNSENHGSFSNLDNGISLPRVLRQEYIGCEKQVQWHCLGEKIHILGYSQASQSMCCQYQSPQVSSSRQAVEGMGCCWDSWSPMWRMLKYAELEHRVYNQENVALLVYLLCDRSWASYHLWTLQFHAGNKNTCLGP